MKNKMAAGRATTDETDGYKQLVGKKLRVKLGKSFRDRSNNAFHTISYDFKPKSIDSTQSERLKVLQGGELEVSIPNVQMETVDDVTMFRGALVPTQKECLLMIDLHKGEAVLERITNKVNLKVVRPARKQQPRLQAVAKDRPVSPSVPPPKQGSQPPGPSAAASGVGIVAKQSKGKQPRAKKRAVEGGPSTSSPSNPPRPSQPKKTKVKKQPKVSERKTTQPESQKPIRPPSPPADIPQKRPFPPLSSPSSSDSESDEEGGPERNALHTPKPTQECMQPPDEGVVHQITSGFTPQTTAASSSSSSESDSSSNASSSEGEQEDGTQGITMVTGERKQAPARSMSLLKNDLQLSSYSDSDSSS